MSQPRRVFVTKGKIIAAVVALLVIAGVAGAIVINQRASVTLVSVEAATRGSLSVMVGTSGKVEADETAEIYPPSAGTLASIDVTDGQVVKAGDLIATMDTALLDLQVAQAQAAYDAARAQAGTINATAPSSADERAASAAVSAARSAYEAASAQYELAKRGGTDPTALAQAEAAVAPAKLASNAASAAYDAFKTSVYDPAPEPKDPALVQALAALETARNQAAETLATAETALAALNAGPNPVLVAGAKAARDQAWAAYQGALAQQMKLASTDLGAARTSASSGVETARQALELAISNRERAEMRAPIDGTVVFGGAGASLAASAFGGGGSSAGKPSVGSAVSPASAPFSVVAFDALVFAAQVYEADFARIEVGQKVEISLDAFADETFAATVERIDRTAVTTTTGGTAFTVICRIQGGPDALTGMNGSAEIEVESIESVLSVPVEAVLDEGGETFVYVIDGGTAIRTVVAVGRFTDTRAEITDGLEEGARVAVTGLGELADGASVRVK
jgi:multidrug efflux pump subunit AcrA (membrane-fusion protein)